MNELIYTIDGCMVQKTPQTDIAKLFAKSFNNYILVLLKDFWSENYEDLKVFYLFINKQLN